MDDLFDDPIADLLSEGSNDSFFEDPKLKTKKPTKSVSNVFNLGDDKLEAEKVIEDKKEEHTLNFQSTESLLVTKPMEVKQRRPSIDKGDINDLLDTHETKKSKADVMNEILGISNKPEQKVFTFDDILKGSTVKKEAPKKIDDGDSILTKEPRRTRRSSTSLDPLGLLDIVKSPETKRKNEPLRTPADDVEIKITQSTSILPSTEKTSSDNLTKTSKSVSFLETKEPTLFSEFSTQRGRREAPKKQAVESDLPDWLKGSSTSMQSQSVELTAKPAVTNLQTEISEEKKIKPESTVSVKESAGTGIFL